jgi:hypothetical protein
MDFKLVTLFLGLTLPVGALQPCPPEPVPGGDGSFHVNSSSLILNKTVISSTDEYIIDFVMKSAYDDNLLPCHGEGSSPAGYDFPSIQGTCTYPDDGVLGHNVGTTWAYGPSPDYWIRNGTIDMGHYDIIYKLGSVNQDFYCTSRGGTHK